MLTDHASLLDVLTVVVIPHVSSPPVLTVASAPYFFLLFALTVVMCFPFLVIAMQRKKPQLVLQKSISCLLVYTSSHGYLIVVVVPSLSHVSSLDLVIADAYHFLATLVALCSIIDFYFDPHAFAVAPHISSLVVLTVAVAHSYLLCASFPVVLTFLVAPSYLPHVSSLVVPSVPVAVVVVVHIFVSVVFEQSPIEVEVVVEDIHLSDVIVGDDEGMTDHTHEDTPPLHRGTC